MSEAEVMLVLNTLIYSDSFKKKELKNKTLREVVSAGLITKPETVTDKEWEGIKNAIKTDPALSNIKIEKIEYVEDKQLNVLFSDGDKALVAFKGTDKHEWHDNAAGGQWNITDTPQQINANEFINNYCQGFKTVIASGHSKGGNKAQYVGVVNPLVTRAYSFDGQGMGYGFMLKYRDEIELNSSKINLYNYSSDYVNPLFITLDKANIHFVKSEKTILGLLFEKNFYELAMLHALSRMFDTSGETLKMKSINNVEQDNVSKLVNSLTEYLMLTLSDEDWYYLSNIMVEQLEGGDCSKEFDKTKIPEGFLARVSDAMLKYLTTKVNLSEMDALQIIALLMPQLLPEWLVGSGKELSWKALKSKINEMVGEIVPNDIVRDFSIVKQTWFKELVKEVEEEPIWDVTKWDIWMRVGDALTDGYTIQDAGNSVDKYYKHLIDTEDLTVKKAEQIFEDVYKEDKQFATTIKDLTEMLDNTNKDFRDNLVDKILK